MKAKNIFIYLISISLMVQTSTFAQQRGPASSNIPMLEMLPPHLQIPVDDLGTESMNPAFIYKEEIIAEESEELEPMQMSSDITDQKDPSIFQAKGNAQAKLSFTKWVPFAKKQGLGTNVAIASGGATLIATVVAFLQFKYKPGAWVDDQSKPQYRDSAGRWVYPQVYRPEIRKTPAPAYWLAIPAAALASAIGTVIVMAITAGGDKELTRKISINTNFEGQYWGEGKFSGVLTLSGRKKCAPVSIQLFGDKNAYNTYDLKIKNPENAALNNISFGTYNAYGKKTITLDRDIEITSSGRRGTACKWKLSNSTSLLF